MRISVAALFAGMLLFTLGAGPAAPQQSEKTEPTSAEEAFRKALSTREPQERLRAFQQILKDYPDSAAARNGAVDFNIFTLSTAAAGAAAREARRAAEGFMAKVQDDADTRAVENYMMASIFSRSDCLWGDVERYARKALGAWDSRGTSVPPKRLGFDLERAVVLTTLGQAIYRQGRENEAAGVLRDAYAGRANEPGVVNQVVPLLLDIATKQGRADDQVEWLTALALYGGLTPERRAALEGAYRQTHGGSLEGLEAMLDSRYEAELPDRVAVTPFSRPASPGARTVLAEMFTGTSCAPCVGLDLAFEAVLRRYRPQDAVLLVYHEHVPAPDPLVSPSSEARARAYGVQGVPQYVLDGVRADTGGGGKATEAGEIFHSRLQPAIDDRLAVPADAQVALRAARTGDLVRVHVDVDRVNAGAGGRLTLQIALVEKRVRYSGTNGVRFHPMVVRKLTGDGDGLPVDPARGIGVDHVFDLEAVEGELRTALDEREKRDARDGRVAFTDRKTDIDRSQLAVVAFVQEGLGGRVLQAAWAELR